MLLRSITIIVNAFAQLILGICYGPSGPITIATRNWARGPITIVYGYGPRAHSYYYNTAKGFALSLTHCLGLRPRIWVNAIEF